MKRGIKFMRLAATIYVALYFLCNAALIHNHIIDGHNISNAHLFKGIQHTAEEAEIISLFNITPAESAETTHIPPFEVAWQEEVNTIAPESASVRTADALSLRAPPSFQL